MSNHDLDGLDRLAADYRKLPRPEPSPTLDAAILAQARAAVARPARRTRWPTWIASAAVVTLAVGLAWRVRERAEVEDAETRAARVEQPAAPARDLDRGESPAPPDSVAPASAKQQVSGGFDAAANAEAPVAMDVPAPEAESAKAKRESIDGADARGPELRKQTAPQGAPKPAPAAPPAPPPPAPAAVAQPTESGQLETIAVQGSRVRRTDAEASAPQLVVEPEPIEEKAATAPEPFPASVAGASRPAEGEAASRAKEDALAGARRERAAAAAESDDHRADATPAASTSGRLGMAAPRDAQRDEAYAIDHIRALLRDGRRDEALRALAEFRRRFPDAELPEDLRGLER